MNGSIVLSYLVILTIYGKIHSKSVTVFIKIIAHMTLYNAAIQS